MSANRRKRSAGERPPTAHSMRRVVRPGKPAWVAGSVLGPVLALALIAAAASIGVIRSAGGGVTTAETIARQTSAGDAESLRVNVLRRFAHDTSAYTQGLIWSEGKLYESTGQYGASTLRRVDPQTGAVEHRVAISPAFFGEGLARVGNRLIMLTWKAQRAFVFEFDSFTPTGSFNYRGEGWGLCDDGSRLIMSNGSDRLTFRDRETFEPVGDVGVTLRGLPLPQINELECVDGAVYANVYQQEFLVRIDPATGRVTQYIDAAGLLTLEERRGTDVLNGIAYDPDAETFYLTGKLWPAMFEVTFE